MVAEVWRAEEADKAVVDDEDGNELDTTLLGGVGAAADVVVSVSVDKAG